MVKFALSVMRRRRRLLHSGDRPLNGMPESANRHQEYSDAIFGSSDPLAHLQEVF